MPPAPTPAPEPGMFRDLADFMDEAEPIRLPIKGKLYEFPGSIPGRTGLLLTAALDSAASSARGGKGGPGTGARDVDPELVELLGDDDEATVWAQVFDGADRELAADGLDNRVIRHVFLTLITWHTAGPDAALAAWESAGKAPAPNRATRRSRPASAAAGSTTRSPARGSGTRATSRASGSTGRTSSRAGR